MKIQPLYNRVLLRPIHRRRTTDGEGGIEIPDGADRLPLARVIAVGQGRVDDQGQLHPLLVRPGQIVVRPRAELTVGTDEGEALWIAAEDAIPAIVDDPSLDGCEEGVSMAEVEALARAKAEERESKERMAALAGKVDYLIAKGKRRPH